MSSSLALIECINSYSPATSVVRGSEIRVMELARKSFPPSDLAGLYGHGSWP